MKTMLKSHKKSVVTLLLCVCAFVIGVAGFFCIKPSAEARAYAETVLPRMEISDDTILSEMADEDCINFVISRGVEIPSDFVNSPELGTIIKEIIEMVEYNPTYEFVFNYNVTLKFANDIKNVVNDFYGVNVLEETSSVSTYASYSLQDNTFYSNSGYMNYNCYAFAINRNESPAEYSTAKQYQPGDFSGKNFSMSLSISQMAQVVKADLEKLGYSNITVSTECEQSFTRRTICIRKGSSDYHFMRYENAESAWLHKPGFTSILKHNYSPSNDVIWKAEYVDLNGNAGLSSTTYTSTIYYISYDYFGGGTGQAYDPFIISTPDHFRNMAFVYKQEYVTYQGYEKRIAHSFKLANSIVIPGDWTPFPYKFSGDFDGGGHYISYSMYLTQEDIDTSIYQGLFGFVTNGGKIHDLELMNCTIISDTSTTLSRSSDYIDVGIVAAAFYEAVGLTNVTVTNSKIECKISNASIGALAGSFNWGYADYCVVRQLNGTASITNNTHGYLGGMAGLGDIYRFRNCSVTISLKNTSFNSDNDMMGEIVGNSNDSPSAYNTTANVTMDKGSCLAAGSLITLADGTQKPVEALTGTEMLLVWNLYTGQYDIAPILFIDRDSAQKYSIINLSFSNGETVKVVSEHGFWDYNLNRYVYLDKDAAQYVGHWFCSQTTDANGDMITNRVQLTAVTIQTERVEVYSPVTYGHLCYYVNGMLSMPGGIAGLFNIFEVDAESMKYDTALMQADIKEYGLFTYEEFAEMLPIPQEVFDAFNAQYFKVAIGKGMITEERLVQLVDRYAEQLGIK